MGARFHTRHDVMFRVWNVMCSSFALKRRSMFVPGRHFTVPNSGTVLSLCHSTHKKTPKAYGDHHKQLKHTGMHYAGTTPREN